MLTSLRIVNFAIVKELDLDFSKGMTAFTGETGAGKSIMIDALLLALGSRADCSIVRPHQEKCEVTATFHLEENAQAREWLNQHDVSIEDGELLLRRQLYAEGRSKSYINGQPFPLQKIKELSEQLVQIHGQHQHQTLMHHQTHRQQLDNYANHDNLLKEVHGAYKQCQQIKIDLNSLITEDKADDKIAFLQFQKDELQALALQPSEVDDLHQEHQLLHHAKDYLQAAQQATALLNGEEDATVTIHLNQVLHLLQRLPQDNKHLITAIELISTAIIHCEEAKEAIDDFLTQVHLDPERLQTVEERLSLLHQMARKYHVDVKQLLHHEKTISQTLETLKSLDEKIAKLQQDYQKAENVYRAKAQELTASRLKHAEKMSTDISTIIKQLGMPNGQLRVAINPLESMQAHGVDRVEYRICTNPGLPEEALNKIASGGELSRISLAIQMICGQRGTAPTLIFDEVDVGIGGGTAALVGQLLRQLGECLQVFCVTHQPQVAASAHAHFMVEKYTESEETFSRIVPLTVEGKINEVARMLSGLTITEQTRLHAKELLAHE